MSDPYLPAGCSDGDPYFDDGESQRSDHPYHKPDHPEYKDPNIVVWCRVLHLSEQGYPYANKLYREEADKFAASMGQTITDWHADCAFTLGNQAYQVVSGRGCLDIIKRHKVAVKKSEAAA